MVKKLHEQEKKEQQNTERKGENKAEVLFASKSFYSSLQFSITIEKISFPALLAAKEIKMPRSLLRPPIS